MTDDNKNTVITTITGSTAATLTEAFGPQIWKAPELPVARLPDDHPVYNLLGRLASDWSHVEHTLDTIIWALARVEPEAGACVTSQLLGHYGRFKAIVALLTLHEQKTQKKTAHLTARATKLQGKANRPGDQRNRNIHDPWYIFTGHDVPGQFKAMPHKDLRFGVHPRDLEEIKGTLDAIYKFSAQVEELRTDIIKMLAETT